MTHAATVSKTTMMSALWPAAGRAAWVRAIFLAVGGSLLLTFSAKVQVPFWPVPMTLQTLAVLVVGMTFGPRLGAATVGLYLLEGALGLPVFAGTPVKGIGLAYMAGPTGGYLLGFLVAAYAVGILAHRGWDRRLTAALAAMALGTALIYVFGVAWLAYLTDFKTAIMAGVVPFLPAAALKVALAAALLRASWAWIGRRSS